ncbi:hypothetical protein Tco_0400367 [Tanacetum coccineum]
MEDGIFLNQSKYIKEMLKKFGLEDSKPTKTSMSTEIKLSKDDEADSVDNTKYRDEIMPLSNQEDYKRTKVYKPRIHRSKHMDDDIRESYRTLKECIIHEGRFVTPSFIEQNNMPHFQAIGLESFLTLDEPICPRFVTEFYHSLEVKRSRDDYPYIEFKLGNRDHINACTAYMLYYLKIKKKFNLTAMILLRMEGFKKNTYGRMPYAMLLIRLFKHILQSNPQSIVPFCSFTYHERVMNPLDISRKTIKDEGKRADPPSSSSSSDENKEPSILEFYEELYDSEDLTDEQKEKIGMFKCLNRYFDTITKYLKKQK